MIIKVYTASMYSVVDYIKIYFYDIHLLDMTIAINRVVVMLNIFV